MNAPNNPIASILSFTDGAQPLGTKGASDGDVLTWDTGTNTWRGEAAAAAGLPSTGSTGMVAQTGASTTVARTITGTANRITVSNGSGVSGNPTLDVGSNVYVAGGTNVAIGDGGTNADTAAGALVNLGALASPYTATPAASNFTLRSGSGATLTDGTGTMAGTLLLVASSNQGQYTYGTAPSSMFTYIGCFNLNTPASTGLTGLTVTEAGGTGKVIRFGVYKDSVTPKVQVQQFATPSSVGGTISFAGTDINTYGWCGADVWLKVEQTASDLVYYISSNGSDWVQVFTEAKAAYLTVGLVGLWVEPSTVGCRVRSLSLT